MPTVDVPPATAGHPFRLPRSRVHELLGWNVWVAHGSHADVAILHAGELLEVILAEKDAGPGSDDGGSFSSRTRLLLGGDGRCTATHVASPSVLHVAHDGTSTAVAPGAGGRSSLETGFGDVLVATTAGFLQVAPAGLLAQVPQRTSRRRTLAGMADDLVRRVGRSPGGQRAGVVVAQRVWPAGA